MNRTQRQCESFLIAIPTTRVTKVSALLQSISAEMVQVSRAVDVLIIDNAPTSEKFNLASIVHPGIHPVVLKESKPGVVHARNKALRYFRNSVHDYLVFLDDDQRVSLAWFSSLCDLVREFPTSILKGPVEYILPVDTLDDYVNHYWTASRKRKEGAIPQATGTGNSVIPRQILATNSWPEFDPRFNKIGGEDTDFFYRLAKVGATTIWSNALVVTEVVDQNRISRSWIRSRFRRTGLVRATIDDSRSKSLIGGVARLCIGLLWKLGSLIRSRHNTHRIDTLFYSGLGFLDHAFSRMTPNHYGS